MGRKQAVFTWARNGYNYDPLSIRFQKQHHSAPLFKFHWTRRNILNFKIFLFESGSENLQLAELQESSLYQSYSCKSHTTHLTDKLAYKALLSKGSWSLEGLQYWRITHLRVAVWIFDVSGLIALYMTFSVSFLVLIHDEPLSPPDVLGYPAFSCDDAVQLGARFDAACWIMHTYVRVTRLLAIKNTRSDWA